MDSACPPPLAERGRGRLGAQHHSWSGAQDLAWLPSWCLTRSVSSQVLCQGRCSPPRDYPVCVCPACVAAAACQGVCLWVHRADSRDHCLWNALACPGTFCRQGIGQGRIQQCLVHRGEEGAVLELCRAGAPAVGSRVMDGLEAGWPEGCVGMCWVYSWCYFSEFPPRARGCFPGDYRQLILSNLVSFESTGN